MRILVVEDERELCQTIVRSLRRLAYSVDPCYDGDAAIALLGSERYDLVLLDLNLPGADGMTVLRTLRQTDRKKQMKLPPSRPMRFTSSDGFLIFVGRSNRQNDRLTTRTAEKWDLWFHTQKIHGSHVILSTGGGRPDAQSIAEAASLAAYFSQAQSSTKVPVDFTQVKFVKKPAAAKPGMVIYTNYQTILADPNEELVKHLLVK